MASGGGESSAQHDAELDELLDSALDDFDKTSAPPAPDPAAASCSANSDAQKPPILEDSKLFETLFEGEMAAQAKEEWEKAMTELAQEEPELLQHFHKLSEAAGKVGSDTASQQEFTSCLKETLKGMAKNADNLQSAGLAGDDLVKALEGLGLEEGSEGGGEDGNILPIMQSIMQNLLSKEVLYPSLKEITTKYPEWLDANKPNLSPEDYQRYEQQAKIMGEICKRFEKEEEGTEDKESMFEGVMDLMQQLQDLGQPPKELAGDAPAGLNFDMESLFLPGGAGAGAGATEQCSIM
ncbi:peroxisomal biogenesis factor 19 [Solea senegalensis]|uniref:Peroxisomal biogenesis factor 19 n=1 Tax=Solea senegalensis TaxID=28829 RepID=A0AAV6TBC8_SOLSE|nr:peroxisomal biogenesis factor 19 [Solea senegalensis]KAG7526709.1 peroxisomal biogenesis factor 19 [Solea senegalensis]